MKTDEEKGSSGRGSSNRCEKSIAPPDHHTTHLALEKVDQRGVEGVQLCLLLVAEWFAVCDTHTHTNAQTRRHTDTQTHTDTHTYTHTHTHIHIHARDREVGTWVSAHE